MRGVGLLLIDVRGRRVDRIGYIVVGANDAVRTRVAACPRHQHEIRPAVVLVARDTVRTRVVQRVVLLQGHEDHAITALVDQVEPVIEELPEEGHEGVERRRQALVRSNIRDQQLVDASNVRTRIGAVPVLRGGEDRGRVVDRLVDDQVTDQARCGVRHRRSVALSVGGAVLCVREDPRHSLRELLVRLAEGRLALDEIVERSIHRSQAPRNTCVGEDVEQLFARRMSLGKLDLLEDEIEILSVEGQVAGS